MKSIKRAQKKSIFLDEEIVSLEQVTEDNEEEIEKLKGGINELGEIAEENMSHCETMLGRMK